MKCPNCGANVDELAETCPNCKINFDDFEKNQKRLLGEETEDNSKTNLLKAINGLQVAGCGIGALVAWSNELVLTGFLIIIGSIITFAFLKGFYDIIDLLDSINNKLDK